MSKETEDIKPDPTPQDSNGEDPFVISVDGSHYKLVSHGFEHKDGQCNPNFESPLIISPTDGNPFDAFADDGCEVKNLLDGLKNGTIVPVSNEDEPNFISRLGIQISIANGDPIKMLCWKQPFATLMLSKRGNFLGDKIETRTRPVNYRGLVLIVTTAKEYSEKALISLCGGPLALKLQLDVAAHTGWCNGHAIAIGHLWKCQRIEELSDAEKQRTYIHPELWVDRYAWHFKNVFPIEPVPLKGFQGWRDADDDLRSKIKLL